MNQVIFTQKIRLSRIHDFFYTIGSALFVPAFVMVTTLAAAAPNKPVPGAKGDPTENPRKMELTFSNCPASLVTISDDSNYDVTLWNADYWFDPILVSYNRSDCPIDLTITANSTCGAANITLQYELYLDLDNNGSKETLIKSADLPPANRVKIGDYRAFDFRPVPPEEQYAFSIENTVNGNSRTASVRWNTTQQPGTYRLPEFPHGSHRVKWIATDNCGNSATCAWFFDVKDTQKPVFTCINQLSVNAYYFGVSPFIWVSDFVENATDNHTPANQLKYSIRRSGTGVGFPVDMNGNPLYGIQFQCPDGWEQPVEIWVKDKAGNAGMCEASIQILNLGCEYYDLIYVKILTEEGEGVEGVNVDIEGNANGAPNLNQNLPVSDSAGYYPLGYNFALPIGGNYFLQPQHDVDPLNGVTTYDLVLISRHILGLETLNSPYKMIAADANKSNTITTFDIVELRKVILGINSELPNNQSWRFVDKYQVFTDPFNPFADVIKETLPFNPIPSSGIFEFIGVKIGDVNGSAIANNLVSSDDRTNGTLSLHVQDRTIEANEVFEVAFLPSDRPLANQFTLHFEGLELLEVVPGEGMTSDDFGIFPDAITAASFDAAGSFSLRFRAVTAGILSQKLSLDGRITPAKAYNAQEEPLEVALRFEQASGQFVLHNNAPNPFSATTAITFELPADAEVQLSVYDALGRLVFEQKNDYTKGVQQIQLDARQLGAPKGVLYYELRTASGVATGQMMRF